MAATSAPSQSGRAAVKAARHQVSVVCPNGEQKKTELDSSWSLQDQVRAACSKLGLVSDAEEEESFVLTLGPGVASVVCSKAQLSAHLQNPGDVRLHLQRVSTVAERHLEAFKSASAPERSEAAARLRQAVSADSQIAEAVIEQNGLQPALALAIDTKCRDAVPLALLCELLQHYTSDAFSDWLEEFHDIKELRSDLFDALLVSLFLLEEESGAAPGSTQKSCLGLLLFLLQELESGAKVVHEVLQRNRPDKDENLYTVLVSCIGSEEDEDCDEFQARAAQLVVRSLLAAAKDKKLQEQIVVALEGANSDIQARGLQLSSDLKASFDNLLVAYLGACTEVASSSLAGAGRGPEKISKLESEIEHLQKLNAQLKVQLRQQHAAMHRMADFVSVECDPVVEQALEGIIRLGWDSLNWKRGYTMLHYCAECVEEPAVVELIGLLATDVDRKDDNGFRPIDYARQSGREAIIQMLEKLRKIHKKLASGVKVGEKEPERKETNVREVSVKTPEKGQAPRDRFGTRSQSVVKVKADADVRQQLNEATDMNRQLRGAVEKVLDKGWNSITWPSNFSAAHLAAKMGDVKAIDILAQAGADLSRADDWQLTPIDYAAQRGQTEVVAALQRHLTKAQEMAASGKSAEQSPSSPRQRDSEAAVSRSPSPGGLPKSPQKEPPQGPPRESPRNSREEASPSSLGSPRSSVSRPLPAQGSKSSQASENSTAAPVSLGSPTQAPRSSTASPNGARSRPSTAKASLADPGPIPDGLSPQLQKACEAVKRRGWAKIKWPHDFTALHLAAQFGEEKAVEFLLRASAEPGLSTEDSKGLRPLDYAVNKGHKNLSHLLSPNQHVSDSDGGPSSPTGAQGALVAGDAPAAAPAATAPAKEAVPQKEATVRSGGATVAASPNLLKDAKGGALAAQVRKVLIRQRTLRMFTASGDVDLLQERVRSRDRMPEEAGLAELREELRRLKVENQALRQKGSFDAGPVRDEGPVSPGASPTASSRGGSGSGALAGPLTEELLSKYLAELEMFGKDKVFDKMMDSPLAGGQALSLEEANAALRQLDMIIRLAKVAGTQAPLVEREPAATEGVGAADAPPQAKAKGKGPPPGGKGKKGPPPPGAAPAEAPKEEGQGTGGEGTEAKEPAAAAPAAASEAPPAEEAAAAAPAPKAGKAKGKGPPPPGGKGKGPALPKAEGAEPAAADAPAAEQAAGEAAPKAGKGPKGPKGPAKGPGKGPPAPGGKGPPAPAGKGPGGPPAAKGGAKGGKPGKGGKAALETKPAVKPSQPMKPLWWNKMVFGAQLQKGETIWDEVKDEMDKLPIGELTLRFSKSAVAQKEKPKKEEGEKKKEELALIRIITDPQIVVGKEASLRKLPEPSEVARALDELNDKILDIEMLQVVKDNACPNPAQLKELQEVRQKNPNVPLALPESFMWVIGHMPAYQQRIDVWSFAQSYPEQHSSYDQALKDFLSVVECFQESEMLPNVLGIVLAVGNYLNGGTNRGQADAFDLETFGKLEGIKDAAGKDVRHFIFDLFLNQMTDQASQFMEEITPCMININRRIAKDSDGVEKLDKSARIVFEDFDLCVNALHGEFVAKHETMQMILSYFEDPADPFKMQMPAIYADAKEKLDALVTLKDTAKEKYAQLLKWFKIQTMKSSDFCVLWDNLMVPANLILNADVKMKKDFMIPTFCQNKAFTADDLQILWQFKEFDAKSKVTKKKAGAKRRRRFSQRLRDAQAAAEKAAAEGQAPPAPGGAGGAPAAAPAGKGKGKLPPPGKGKKGPAAAAAPAAETSAEAPAAAPEAAAAEPAAAEGAAPPAAGKAKAKGPPGKGKKGPGAPPAAAEPAAEVPTVEEASTPEAVSAEANPEASATPAAGKGKAKGPPAKGKKGPGPPPTAAAEPAPEAPAVEEAAAPEAAAADGAAVAEAAEAAAPAATGKGKAKGPPLKGKKGPGPPPAAAEPEPQTPPAEATVASEATAETGAQVAVEVPASASEGKGKAKGPPAKGKKGPGPPPAAAATPEAPKEEAAVAAVAAVPDASPAEGATAEGTALPAGGKGKAKGPPAKGKKGPVAEPSPTDEGDDTSSETEAAPTPTPAAGKSTGKGPPSKGKKGPGPPPASTAEEPPPASGTQKDADAPLPDDEDLDVAVETSPASPVTADPAEEKSALHPVALQAAKGPPPAGKGKAKGPGKPAKGPPLPPA